MIRAQVHQMIGQCCCHILSAENSKTWMRRCDKRWAWSVGKACQDWNIRNRSKRRSFRQGIQGNHTIQFWMASRPRLLVPWIFRRMKQPARYTQDTLFKWIKMRQNFNQLKEQRNLWLLSMMHGLLRETLGLHHQEIHPCWINRSNVSNILWRLALLISVHWSDWHQFNPKHTFLAPLQIQQVFISLIRVSIFQDLQQ